MFEPSRVQGSAARGRLLARLSESLSHIFETIDGHLAFDGDRAAGLLLHLSGNQAHPPELFANYFDLVAAIQSGEADRAEGILLALLALQPVESGRPAIVDFSSDHLSAAAIDLVKRHISLDSVEGAGLAEINAAESCGRRTQVEAALDRLQRHVPELYAEIEETVGRFILGIGESGAERSFDGASSLEYWGGVLLNAAIPKSDLQVVEMIAHEAGHNVLFGLSPSEFFVTNPESEVHISPLRDDPRPLDGIYHATFVLARMHYAISRLSGAGGLAETEIAEADAMLERSRRNFFDALKVLDTHARYTETGRAIMDGCADYMSGRLRAA